MERNERFDHRLPVLARQIPADMEEVRLLHEWSQPANHIGDFLGARDLEVVVQAIEHRGDPGCHGQLKPEELALRGLRYTSNQVGLGEIRGDQPLKQASGPADLPTLDLAPRRSHGNDVVACDNRWLALHPTHVHRVRVIADVDDIGPAGLPNERWDEEDELVEIAQPFPKAGRGGQSLEPLRWRDGPQLTSQTRQAALQHVPERLHARLVVRNVVADQ
ncbi:hypothetical protein QTH97_24360 [Variovorax sp. J22R24]|nr:hypothetical protein [Variovorax sp. J22R24]MDM0108104.1 hypothetical protein [Variovorax sp. J22R24]